MSGVVRSEGNILRYYYAEEAEAFLAVIDPDDGLFLAPGDMPFRIQKYCMDTNQRVPQTKGQIIRIALESIALKYRYVLEHLEELSGKRLDPFHIIGGGTQNRLLNQFTANATQRTVIAGPIEATAIGNILMQAIGLKHLASLAEAREICSLFF
ncbi:MAG: FGGY-family carbohydrate kinase [Anaerolineales bacterium]